MKVLVFSVVMLTTIMTIFAQENTQDQNACAYARKKGNA